MVYEWVRTIIGLRNNPLAWPYTLIVNGVYFKPYKKYVEFVDEEIPIGDLLGIVPTIMGCVVWNHCMSSLSEPSLARPYFVGQMKSDAEGGIGGVHFGDVGFWDESDTGIIRFPKAPPPYDLAGDVFPPAPDYWLDWPRNREDRRGVTSPYYMWTLGLHKNDTYSGDMLKKTSFIGETVGGGSLMLVFAMTEDAPKDAFTVRGLVRQMLEHSGADMYRLDGGNSVGMVLRGCQPSSMPVLGARHYAGIIGGGLPLFQLKTNGNVNNYLMFRVYE